MDRELEIMPGVAEQDWLSAFERTLDALPPGGASGKRGALKAEGHVAVPKLKAES